MGTPPPSAGVVVTTYGGTGISGNHDGPLASATFASPSGLAVGPHGEIYIVDKALNTLRVIVDGNVRTLVGSEAGDPVWRAGGYRDGPLATAAFNHPEGVAVAPDGSLIVADTLDLAVRRVKDGMVTTVAGSPGHFGTQDGPVATASFKFPVGVAVDANGNIYVADQQNAVREISSDGVVSTLPIPNVADVTGIALGTGSAPRLYVADETGLVVWNLAKQTVEFRFASEPQFRKASDWPQSHVPAGRPYAVAADGHFDVAYTDIGVNSVRRLNGDFARGLAGGDAFDPNLSGGYVDGSGTDARFYAPLAIAKVPSGWLVADAGNHRLRLISHVDDQRPPEPDGTNLKNYYSGTRPAIALLGDSQLWYDAQYDDSIAGQLHRRLTGFDVVPLAIPRIQDPAAFAGFSTATLAPLAKVESVVYLFDDTGVLKYGIGGYREMLGDDAWRPALAAQFAAARTTLGASFAHFILVYMPSGAEASPNELTYGQQVSFTKATAQYDAITEFHRRVKDVIAAAGFDEVDAWDAFRAAEADGRGPLYGPFDYHLSAAGRALMAQVIDEALRRRHIPGMASL